MQRVVELIRKGGRDLYGIYIFFDDMMEDSNVGWPMSHIPNDPIYTKRHFFLHSRRLYTVYGLYQSKIQIIPFIDFGKRVFMILFGGWN